MKNFSRLSDWLTWQETLHPRAIDLGLDRLKEVLARLEWQTPACPVVIIGGTNGKGSCVALLAAICKANNYRVGAFTSPHLIRYNERIKIDDREISDTELVAAFERIEAVRGDVSLTFFEFNTLAALLAFASANLDLIILEVGLGGRLDSVNVVDADVAIVSSIALDHCDWLGPDVESIGREKAGIFRASRPAIFGSRVRPNSIVSEAQRIGAQLFSLGEQFDCRQNDASWDFIGDTPNFAGLPLPHLKGDVQFENAASVLAALQCLQARLPISRAAVEEGLRKVQLPGRFQIVTSSARDWLLDVAHNPAAARTLASNLQQLSQSSQQSHKGRVLAVCGMFADKDVDGVIDAVKTQIDLWIVATVSGARALPAEQLTEKIKSAGGKVEAIVASIAEACVLAKKVAADDDRIVVFGSFHAVGPALEWLQSQS